jgi:hypothetical protein
LFSFRAIMRERERERERERGCSYEGPCDRSWFGWFLVEEMFW